MTLNDILELIRAGYTKADIEAMEAAPTPAPAKVPAKPASDPKPAKPASDPKPAKPAADPKPAQPAQPAEAPDDPVLAELKALRDQMSKLSLAQGAAKIPNQEDLMNKALAKLIGG